MIAAMLSETDEFDYALRDREPAGPAKSFDRPSLARYCTRARYSRRKSRQGSSGAHRRRLKLA